MLNHFMRKHSIKCIRWIGQILSGGNNRMRCIFTRLENTIKLNIESLHSNSKRGRDIGAVTQKMLKDVGVKVDSVGLAFGPVIKKVLSGQYRMSTWRMSSSPDQGAALFRMFHSKSRGNFSHYKNPGMDKLLIAQRMETDPGKRGEIFCRIARLINEDVPILYRGGMRNHAIARASVKGVPPMPHSILQLSEAWIDR